MSGNPWRMQQYNSEIFTPDQQATLLWCCRGHARMLAAAAVFSKRVTRVTDGIIYNWITQQIQKTCQAVKDMELQRAFGTIRHIREVLQGG